MALSSLDAEILAFEARSARVAKEERIRAELGISPARYYQRLNVLIDDAEVISQYPVMTARLRRVRERRAQERRGDL